jgi:hypothetical protein
MPDTFTKARRVEITPLAARYRLPAAYSFGFFAVIGKLMSHLGSQSIGSFREEQQLHVIGGERFLYSKYGRSQFFAYRRFRIATKPLFSNRGGPFLGSFPSCANNWFEI